MKTAEEWYVDWGKSGCTRVEFNRLIQDDALEAAAELADKRGYPLICEEIRAMKSPPPLPALLPCPFCGAQTVASFIVGRNAKHVVRCPNGCFETPGFQAELEAILHANRRATP